MMVRRILSGTVFVALALGGAVLASAPAHAVAPAAGGVTVTAAADADGCPLTPMQIKHGREVLTNAKSFLNHPAIKPHRPKLTVESYESVISDAADCMLAVADIQRKYAAAKDAQNTYLMCLAGSVIDGRSCDAELSNLRAALHDLELAVYLLEQRCPWLRV